MCVYSYRLQSFEIYASMYNIGVIYNIGVKAQNHIVGFGFHSGQLTKPRRGKWL